MGMGADSPSPGWRGKRSRRVNVVRSDHIGAAQLDMYSIASCFIKAGPFSQKTARLWFVSLLLGILIATASCGGGTRAQLPQTGTLSGNWEIALARHVSPDPPLLFTGFLVQSGNSITGNLVLGSNCPGVGPVTGTLNGQDVSLTINEFGQEISLIGTAPSGTAPMGGEFSNLAGACTAYANTGTWSAVQVTPLAGKFHGTFSSTPGIGNGTLEVTGTLDQGPNTGNSTATLSGTITATGLPHFCSYLTAADIRGLVSGTTVTLNLYGPDGSQIAQIGQIGTSGAIVTPDGKALRGSYSFPAISSSCTGDQGTFQLTFP